VGIPIPDFSLDPEKKGNVIEMEKRELNPATAYVRAYEGTINGDNFVRSATDTRNLTKSRDAAVRKEYNSPMKYDSIDDA
jgi:hypothetical protein